ncbi:MAG: hypothetical protein ACM3NQ_02415 [Bacteroidales bacterium]
MRAKERSRKHAHFISREAEADAGAANLSGGELTVCQGSGSNLDVPLNPGM